ncbi:MAG: hypothetical protein IIT58_08030 [Treponema sp.]|nr:hypothetical protein [Treponema sp.]
MKRFFFAFFSLLFLAFQANAKTIFTTQNKNSYISLQSPDKNNEFYHVIVSGKQSKFSKDVVHVFFAEETNSYDYVKSILEKTPQNNTWWQFVNHSIKLDKTGILYWNDFYATKKYFKNGCFVDERFYYSYDTSVFTKNKRIIDDSKKTEEE